ncbi:MAG: FTR1 family protein [Jatrophihabitans sp.]|uniref:FTR1 family protein n=1 Tax=Jatrophihabitans sp. TaxID=1932789 RepID=UPI0039112545
MLPTFVIGLREGLEAALIVGIIAAFLRKQGRRDLLRSVLLGVAVAVGLCVAVGVGLDAYSHNLPQRRQEGSRPSSARSRSAWSPTWSSGCGGTPATSRANSRVWPPAPWPADRAPGARWC